MNKPTCTFDGCNNVRYNVTRGLCQTHDTMFRKGQALRPIGRHKLPIAERMASKTLVTDTCWIWQDAPCTDGYGQIRHDGRMWMAHRLAYTLAVGEIPAGAVIDHQCRVRMCVNPAHLAVSTDKLNAQNRSATGHGRSGVRGVWKLPDGRWGARVKRSGHTYSGGDYLTVEEAAMAVRDLRLRVHTNNLCDRDT